MAVDGKALSTLFLDRAPGATMLPCRRKLP
jgi:hypothetical protein